MLAWLRAYAATTASTASYSRWLDAAPQDRATNPPRSTSIGYRDVLTRLWPLDPVPAWGCRTVSSSQAHVVRQHETGGLEADGGEHVPRAMVRRPQRRR